MKYILLRHPQTHERRLVLGFAPQTHADLIVPAVAEGYQATTAGFVRCLGDGRFVTFGESTSLRIGSHPDDARILGAFYKATLSTAADPGAGYANLHPRC